MAEHYLDREQTKAKHEILRRYLVPFSNKILRTWKTLDFIDGFSGPWENRDHDNLSDTSIGIALRTFSEVAESLGHMPSEPKIRCIFNEKNAGTYGKLQDFLHRRAGDFPLVKVSTFQGEFADNADRIKRAADHGFQLLFVDPTGYTGFSPSSLSIFKGRSTEIIVNIMRSFMERFVAGNHRDRELALVQLLGPTRARYLLDTGLSINTLEAEYLSMLRSTLEYKYAGYSPIHNPDKNQIHFKLAYATNHPTGMDVMRGAEFHALGEHDRDRYKKAVKDQPKDLFSEMIDEIELEGPYLRERKQHKERAAETLLKVLSGRRDAIAFGELAAIAQQTLYLKRTELSDELVRMADNGVVRDSWRARGGRKPTENDLIARADG